MVTTSVRTPATAAWGDPMWNTTTGGTSVETRHMVAIDVRELQEIRGIAASAQQVAVGLQTKMNILETKFNKAIEILTSRGINITEMI